MLKRIIAVRHAEPETSGYADIDLRPLTARGREIHTQATHALKARGVQPTAIYASPILRTMQTAEIMADIFGLEVIAEPLLADQYNSEELLKKLAALRDEQTIILVGHAPTLSAFVHDLVDDEVLTSGLSTSGMVIVEFADIPRLGRGRFVRYYPPTGKA